MLINSLHLLLTYQCTLECDHSFVWGSPAQSGTLSLSQITEILRQGRELGSVDSIYFEGGEPFLYYRILRRGVEQAARMGFKVGVVTNAYWATNVSDAVEWLKPFAGQLADLSFSGDRYHWGESDEHAQNACAAADQLNIPHDVLSIAEPEHDGSASSHGQLAAGESQVMYRGRAAVKLVDRATLLPWDTFVECPHEDLRNPGRVHIDPLGNVHLCQGIVVGNLFHAPLCEICENYDAGQHPIAAPLLAGGPVELVRRFDVPHAARYADACHLCYESRVQLRSRLPEVLGPAQVYGVF